MTDNNIKIEIRNSHFVRLDTVTDSRGDLSFGEVGRNLPFEIKRVFWTYNINERAERCNHAHRREWEVIFPIGGAWTIDMDDGQRKQTFRMDDPSVGLLIPPLVWCRLYDFEKGACCLCLASNEYQPEDYIHSYEEFIRLTDVK